MLFRYLHWRSRQKRQSSPARFSSVSARGWARFLHTRLGFCNTVHLWKAPSFGVEIDWQAVEKFRA